MPNLLRIWVLLILAISSVSIANGQVTTPVPQRTTKASVQTIGKARPSGDTTAASDTLKKPKGDITTTIKYNADDSIRFDMETRKAYLFGNAHIDYGDISLNAELIDIDWITGTIVAKGVADTSGKLKGNPVFSQSGEKYEAKVIKYNFKTRKGIISDVVTQQGDGFLHGEQVKKKKSGEMYVNHARYTTCNLSTPHFHINATKIKVIPGDRLISGPFNLFIGDVPTPLGFAFGMFPTPKTNSSGLIIPAYGESLDRGFFLRNGGFYWAASDYIGIKLLGEIYSKGGWGASMLSNYKKRYAYEGSVDFRFNRRTRGDEGSASNLVGEDFWINWSHMPQSKGTGRFSANVNAGTNTYNKRNAFSANNYLSTNFSSNVTYFKVFQGTPFSMGVSMRQDQNTSTGIMNFELPSVSFNMAQIYPFKSLGTTGKTWYEKLNISYSASGSNFISNATVRSMPSAITGVKFLKQARDVMADSILPFNGQNFDELLKRSRQQASHTIPITTTVQIFKYFNITPSFNYRETWSFRQYAYTFVPDSNALRYQVIDRFTRSFNFNTNASLATRFYGTIYGRRIGVEAFRHTVIPSVGFTYAPDFSDPYFGMYKDVQVDKSGRTRRISPLISDVPFSGRTGSISMSLSNILEMKLRNKADTTGKEKFKKVTLLDDLGFRSSYNLAADSFRLSTTSISARTRLLQKVDINFNGTIDPYVYVVTGVEKGQTKQRRLDQYAWNHGGGIGQLSFASLNFSTSLNPKANAKKNNLRKQQTDNSLTPMQQQQLAYINANPDLYVDFNIPWNVNIGYNLNYSKNGLDKSSLSHYLNFSGDVNLTEKWKVGMSSAYDFDLKKFGYTNVNIYRDLHCWEMRLNWIPFGLRQSYSFDINVKASILQDLKLSRRRSWYDR